MAKRSIVCGALSCASFLSAVAVAQVPDGWYVYSAFSPSRGPIGVFASHPRAPGAPTEITNLQGDLVVTGGSCILHRNRDGAILVGERSPTDHSVDLHVIWLNGTSVLLDASFSMGTGGPCCGEIPQMALLPDDRVVVAATDLSAGPLKNYLTTSYGWQGVGIVDTQSGLITPIDITNGASIVDVFNGLAVSRDGTTVYAGTYVSATQGDIWEFPLAGGAATLVASVPAGLSNLGIDADGDLWVTTLNASAALFEVDVDTGIVTQVAQTNGSLNAITYDDTTGNFAVLSANSGVPPRSVFWMEPDGTDHMLTNPGLGTLSGVAINPNPEVFGEVPAFDASYEWRMPNPGGLPQAGNTGFHLVLDATGNVQQGWALLCRGIGAASFELFGTPLYGDLTHIITAVYMPMPAPFLFSMSLPSTTTLVGETFVVQSLHPNGVDWPSSRPIEFTVM